VTASLGAVRARLRMQLTGETYQQARNLAEGRDGVPNVSHPDQIAIEAAILSELDELYAGEGHPLNGDVYGITRTRPTGQGLTLTLAEGVWETVLEWLLPEPDDIDEDRRVSGIPGLRARALPRRIELFRPRTRAAVTLDLPPREAPEARQWLDELRKDGEPMRSASDWTEPERASLPVYERGNEDAAARSAVLRRLLAFQPFPAPRLVGPSGAVPSSQDFEQILAARQRSQHRPEPRPRSASSPRLALPGVPRPVVLAVVSGHLRPSAGLGGQGRTTVASKLAGALADAGHRVMLVDTDFSGQLPSGHRGMQNTDGVTVIRVPAERGALERVRKRAAEGGQDVVLLDAGPDQQQAIAGAADGWLGVTALWSHPSPLLATEPIGAGGRLPRTDLGWLETMRVEHWAAGWRLVPRDGEALFAPFAPERCAGVILLGVRETPGARAVDVLSGWRTSLPVLRTTIPYLDGRARTRQHEFAAYRSLAAELLNWPPPSRRRRPTSAA
jgi:CobQ/CobB/MinD/ParA nucleotide binding domain